MLTLCFIFLIHSFPFNEVAAGPAPQELVLNENQTIQVSSIEFQGNKEVTTAELQNVSRPYLNRSLSSGDLSALKGRIDLLYQFKGFVGTQITIVSTQAGGSFIIVIKEGSKA